uniref:Gag-Pol polyprotein n=1 Tax=Tanacetum cinerariifolium TaxID=118510 RepID=A0A6L2KD99_TANCI|nr:hypothetical protein [Tanacetum cinerariifolium]
MDNAVQQFSVDKQCWKIAKKELLLENERLLQQIMSQEVLLTVMNYMPLIGDTMNMDGKRNESCDKCVNLQAELLKAQNAFNDLLKCHSQLEKRKIKGKEIVDITTQKPYANTIVSGIFKLDLEPLAPRLFQNREIYLDYLKNTQEQVDILQGIIEQAKAKHPLDNALDFAFQSVDATDDSAAIPEHTTVETPMNMSQENKAHFKAEKEAIHLILTGIRDEIYSTVDACQTAQEMWEAIERLQQDEVSYNKLFDILKQYQKEVNELRAERLARNANPLALAATAQANQDPYYQTSKSHKSYAPSSKPSIPTRSHTSTRHKGNEIAKPITPPSETASEEDNDPEQAQRDKDMEKNLALIAKYFKTIYKPTNNNLKTSSNSWNKNVDTTHGTRMTIILDSLGIRGRKPKRVKDFAYHKEKMLLCKQAEQGVPLQAEQYDWLADTNEEIKEQELEAHYSYMAKI